MDRDGAVEDFIRKWSGASVREGSEGRSFIFQLCGIIGAPAPDQDAVADDDYRFERRVQFVHEDGPPTAGLIDCYKRGCFVLEAKRSRPSRPGLAGKPRGGTDDVMARALEQARNYAGALDERPPFLVLVDVGRSIELWADFSGTGRRYAPYPDRERRRIELSQLRDPAVRRRLRAVWTAPYSLDPARSAKAVTGEIARNLSALQHSVARRLAWTNDGAPEAVTQLIAQCLFAKFCQDIGLLPPKAFNAYLDEYARRPEQFSIAVRNLFDAMCRRGHCEFVKADIPRFGGRLLADRIVLPLRADELALLAASARCAWDELEPTFFGALVEQGAGHAKRRRFGMHFTPRGLVEKVVEPTVIEPLRVAWAGVLSEAKAEERRGDRALARLRVRRFHQHLLNLRILDPACGTGNFLYVAMSALQDLEDEVLARLAELGEPPPPALDGYCISPGQFLGIEQDPLSAKIAEAMLWVGFLQRQVARHRVLPKREPLTGQLAGIVVGDALLEPAPPGGEEARRRPASWPAADYIVGNPPFLSSQRQRRVLGAAYRQALVEAGGPKLRGADFSLRWWDKAAQIALEPRTRLRRFGFILSNAASQPMSRQIIAPSKGPSPPLLWRIADQPWRSERSSAHVRVAILVAGAPAGARPARPMTGEPAPFALKANAGLSFRGVTVGGEGFVPPPPVARRLLRTPGGKTLLRRLVNGRDLAGRPRNAFVIDAFGLEEAQLQATAPEVYFWLLTHAKPERERNARRAYRERWWRLAEERPDLRAATAGQSRRIVTPMTAKHRIFHFLPAEDLPDQGLVCIALSDAYALGVLSSRAHRLWARAMGGKLEDRPRYNNSLCFETFAWPQADASRRTAIGRVAEALDAARLLALQRRPDLTFTQLYNLLDPSAPDTPRVARLRREAHLDDIAALHLRLDAEVAAAYGWPTDLAEPDVVAELLRLNRERKAAEADGVVLKPDGGLASALAGETLPLPLTWSPPMPDLPQAPSEASSRLLEVLRRAGRPLSHTDLGREFVGGS
ncbi:MAG: class I SAM-dependent DNA methyltransferase, partial [Caulobacteraceae bacterium]|nr:class I SAM-dependent DNA methyltransferase [Caulobacteraceae bacterium]